MNRVEMEGQTFCLEIKNGGLTMAMMVHPVLPGVYHLADTMGVCQTLLVGEKQALLVDAGYGIENVRQTAEEITSLPLKVILTHGHHDHVLGARWFSETWMFPEDQEDFAEYTAEPTRRRILNSAKANGLAVDELEYLSAEIPTPKPLAEQTIGLGGLTAQIIHVPAHTPGSCVVYVKERKLLLTADDWNPCTWAFFPKALPAQVFRSNVRKLFELPFEHVLCSHRTALYDRAVMQAFFDGMTDEALLSAPRVTIGGWEQTNTHEVVPAEGQVFVFDRDKLQL